MKRSDMKIGIVGLLTSFGATLCCVLPIAVVFLGLGSGAFMMTTMKYRILLYPLGITGVLVSTYLYFRKKRQCDAQACKMQGGRLNLFMIILSIFIMSMVTYVDFFLTSA